MIQVTPLILCGFLAEGDYLWNARMFVLRPSVWLKALETFKPEVHDACSIAWARRTSDASFIRPGKDEFLAVPPDSIDCAVVERGPRSAFPMKMLPLHGGWSDVGAWDAVWGVLPKDPAGNAQFGDVLSIGSRNTLVHATGRLVGLVGMKDLVVTEPHGPVLVADKRPAKPLSRWLLRSRRSTAKKRVSSGRCTTGPAAGTTASTKTAASR